MDIETFQSLVRTGKSSDPEDPLARQTFKELHWLTSEHLIPLGVKNVLEIGIASGGTTLLFCHLVGEGGRVVGMDIDDSLIPDKLRNSPRFSLVLGDSGSAEVHEQIRALGITFDMILFDGCHETDAVARDTDLYLPFLREGGLAVWHDIRLNPPSGIKPYWYGSLRDQLPNSTEYFLKPDNNGYGLWYKAAAQGKESA